MKSIGILLFVVTLVIGKSFDTQVTINNFPGHVSATPTSVIEVLKGKNLTQLIDLFGYTGLTKNLTGKGPFTVFAPTNTAILNLPVVVRERIVYDPDYALDLLKYLIAPSNLSSSAMTKDKLVTTLNNKTVRCNDYTISGQTVIAVNGAKLVDPDLMANNGIVHIIEKAFWRQGVYNILNLTSNNKELTSFNAAIKSAKVDVTGTGPFTVFAPSNEAFKKYTGKKDAALINYHVVDGTYYSVGLTNKMKLTTQLIYGIFKFKGKLTILIDSDNMISVKGQSGGVVAKVTAIDIPASNGVVYILDTVLPPPTII